MLQIDNISYYVGNSPLIVELSLVAKPGQLIHVKGENGVGKSTLLKIMAGFLQPRSGRIIWNERPLYQHITPIYLAHDLGLTSTYTVSEHITWYACLQDIEITTDRLTQLLSELGLSDFANHYPSQLSRGLCQRLALSRFLLGDSQLWLMDEPATGLDSQGISWLEAVMHQFLDQGGVIVISSHQPLLHESADEIVMQARQSMTGQDRRARW